MPSTIEVPDVVAIVAFDPGRVTGVARGLFPVAGRRTVADCWRGGRAVESYECDGPVEEQAHEMVEETVGWLALANVAGVAIPDLHVVMEDFKLRTQHADLTPVELAAVIRERWLASMWRDIELERQSPSSAKTYATNARLRRWNAWTVGSEHRRDATRHVLLRLSKCLA